MSNLKIFTSNIEQEAVDQISTLLSQPAFENCKVRIMPDVHAGAGCVIGFTADLGDKVIPNIVGVDIGCLDKDTEFLTPNGWKKISDYIENDLVLGYDKNSREANFQKPIFYIKKSCKQFYHFKNSKGLDQMVSEEHKMLVWKGFKNKGYEYFDCSPAELNSFNLQKGYYSFETTFHKEHTEIEDSNVEIQIAVMIAADGCIRYSIDENLNKVELHFSKERKIKRAKKLLDSAKYSYECKSYKNGTTYFYIKLPKKYDKDLTRFYNANSKQLKILAEESLKWDGHEGYRSYYSSTNKKNIDVIQYAFASNGIRAGISKIDGKENWKLNYRVIPTKNSKVGYCNSTIVNSIDGFKYCFTMPTGYFAARRNGKIFITGNCGMLTIKLCSTEMNFEKLDKVIRDNVPYGRNVHEGRIAGGYPNIQNLHCFRNLKDTKRLERSLGTLGGGNHFIEIDIDEEGAYYLVIHTGSRNLGKQVADYYQNLAIELMSGKDKLYEAQAKLIEEYKAQGRRKEIQSAIKELHRQFNPNPLNIPKELCYLTGEYREKYLHDMQICQNFAKANRRQIASIIMTSMNWHIQDMWETIHNYIEISTNMVRKGAISAKHGERVLIPINMRDGCIVGIGKGNQDWNYSAPHGAGRLMSRNKAKEIVSLDEFRASMEGIYTTSVSSDTLDEAPMVYKPMNEILENIKDTVEIEKIIKSVYNFKASE